MSYFLIFLAVILAGAVALFLVGLRRRETRASSGRSELVNGLLDDGLAAPVSNLPPVLLPDAATASDVEKVRFSLGLRGYRMDQVDQVLDQLGAELDQKDQRINVLENQLNPVAQTVPEPSFIDEAIFQRPRHKAAEDLEGKGSAG